MFPQVFKRYHACSDEELMVYVQKGKEKALDELYKRYAKKMLYFFYQKLSQDHEKAQDFLQDLFIKIIEKPCLFDRSKKFSSWIYTIAFNMCKNEYKRGNVRGTKIHDYDLDTIKDTVDNFDSQYDLDGELFISGLNAALLALEENHRMVFVLKYKEGLSIKEISEIMACAEGTTKSRLFYTIKKLSDKLKIFDPHNEIK